MSSSPLKHVGQIAINAQDLDRATAFYRDILGLPHLFTVPDMAFFQCGPLRLMLGKASKPEFDHPASILYYQVDDLPQVHADFSAKGIVFDLPPTLIARMPDHELWLAFFKDSEGNTLALMSEVR